VEQIVRAAVLLLFVTGLAGIGVAFAGREAEGARPLLWRRAVLPAVSRGIDYATPTPTPLPPPTPTPRPLPYQGPVGALHLASARLDGRWPVEQRGTHWDGSREVFDDPSGPAYIAHYRAFGQPGAPGTNSIFAAHINYYGFGDGPFAFLLTAREGDALYVTMDDGSEYAYTVKSVDVLDLDLLDMDAVVFPPLDGHTERITLLSCGGTFVPYPGGGGVYDSRVVLVAERWVP
jgi:hypothetical protein